MAIQSASQPYPFRPPPRPRVTFIYVKKYEEREKTGGVVVCLLSFVCLITMEDNDCEVMVG